MIPAIKPIRRLLFILCFIPGILVACSSGSSSGGSLTGVTWQLTDVKFDGQSTNSIISEPDLYIIHSKPTALRTSKQTATWHISATPPMAINWPSKLAQWHLYIVEPLLSPMNSCKHYRKQPLTPSREVPSPSIPVLMAPWILSRASYTVMEKWTWTIIILC